MNRIISILYLIAVVRYIIIPFDGGLKISVLYKDLNDNPNHIENYVITNSSEAILEFKNKTIPEEKIRLKDVIDYNIYTSTIVPKSVKGYGIEAQEIL